MSSPVDYSCLGAVDSRVVMKQLLSQARNEQRRSRVTPYSMVHS